MKKWFLPNCSKKYILLFSLCCLMAVKLIAQASDTPDSSAVNGLISPQRAMYTFIHYQIEGQENQEQAALPFNRFKGSSKEKLELARQLKAVLDAKGLLVVPEDMPSEPNYEDQVSGISRFMPFPSLPDVYLQRYDGSWYFSQLTIKRIPELYAGSISRLTLIALERLPDWAMEKWLGLLIWQHIALFLWILGSLILMKIFQYFVENYVKRLTSKTKTEWDDNLLHEIESPLGYLFFALFLRLTYTQLLLPVKVNAWMSGSLSMLRDVIIFWLIYKLVNVFCDYLTQLTAKTKNTFDDQLVPLVRKSLKVFTFIVGLIFILQNNGVNVTAFITGLGIGGLAFALAAKDTLANLFGSVTIFLDRPFGIGDWIKAGDAEGVVEEVGFRCTRIRTFYNSQVSVPNSVMANAEIDNMGRRQYRRIFSTLNVTYGTPTEKIQAFVDGIKELIKANPKMRQDYYEVHFNNFGPHSLDVMVYAFFEVPSWSEELSQKHQFFMDIVKLAEKLGVDFAFPTQTIHLAKDQTSIPLAE
jgi:MscS family membrane protein